MTATAEDLKSRKFFSHFLANVPEILTAPAEEADYLTQLQSLIDQCFPGRLGLQIKSLALDECSATFRFGLETAGVHGLMHGGAIFSAGSTLSGIMTMLHGDEKSRNVFTTDSSIRFLRPVQEGQVRVVCKIKSRDNTKLNLQCDFFNDLNKRVARSLYTYVILSD